MRKRSSENKKIRCVACPYSRRRLDGRGQTDSSFLTSVLVGQSTLGVELLIIEDDLTIVIVMTRCFGTKRLPQSAEHEPSACISALHVENLAGGAAARSLPVMKRKAQRAKGDRDNSMSSISTSSTISGRLLYDSLCITV